MDYQRTKSTFEKNCLFVWHNLCFKGRFVGKNELKAPKINQKKFSAFFVTSLKWFTDEKKIKTYRKTVVSSIQVHVDLCN